jgi:SagB-type dehydrogenase family enzyme
MRLALGPISPGISEALDAVFGGGLSEQALVGLVLERDGMSSIPSLLLLLGRLDQAQVLGRILETEHGPFVSVVPTSGPVAAESCELAEGVRWRLSDLAYTRRRGEDVVLESPLARGRVTWQHEDAALAAYHLSAGASLADLDRLLPHVPTPVLRALLQVLAVAGVLEPTDGAADDAPVGHWEFHDLVFHARSRLGRHVEPYGGTYRFAGVSEPPPAVTPVPAGAEMVDLPSPEGASGSGSLLDTMARRRSVRRYGEKPISAAQLATFLHRCQRLTRVIPGAGGELAGRPYPGGGALYELEVYPVVERCSGLAPGLYHYLSDRHALARRAGFDNKVRQLVDDAWFTLAQADRPQVLLVITARFGRVMWKYQSMAYALILKDVGVLYQTMYLVATDMGLAPCALGGGNSDLFAEAAGLDYLDEGAVGEFVVGSRAPEDLAGDGAIATFAPNESG